MTKYYLAISSVIILLCLSSDVAFSADFQTLLQKEEYYQTLSRLFSESRASIDIVVDTIVIDPLDSANPINKLIKTLAEARRRGVRIRVVLEDPRSTENSIAYRYLLENGIDVYFDTSKLLISSKAIVIDSRICIIGSSKWSPDFWRQNSVLSVILDSEDMAKTVEDAIPEVVSTERTPFMEERPEGVLIPDDFLLLKNFGKRFLEERAERTFDLYLVLIKEAQEKSNNEFSSDYEKLGKSLCLEKEFFREFKNVEEKSEYYYERIKKILKVLDERYNLIKYDEVNNKVVVVKQFGINLHKPDESHPCFILSYKFWDAELPYRLNLNATYLYLISLLEAKKSAKAPYWFSNEHTLSNLYGLDSPTLASGLKKLEEVNLIEIAHAPDIKGESKKEARDVYRINPIMTEEEYNRKIEEFNLKYGQDITHQAQEQASEVNEPKDIFIIETFIHLIQKYGYSAVRRINVDTLHHQRSSSLRHIYIVAELLSK